MLGYPLCALRLGKHDELINFRIGRVEEVLRRFEVFIGSRDIGSVPITKPMVFSLCILSADPSLTDSFPVLLIVRKRWQRRKRWQGRQGPDLQEGTAVPFQQGRTPVPRRSCPPFSQELGAPGSSRRCHRSRLHLRHSRVPHSRSFGTRRERLQGSQGEAYHTPAFAIGHSR